MGVPRRWRTPEELVGVALTRSRLILVNEAHDGDRRSVRTRQIGVRIIREAHRAGFRHLAMEALYPHEVAERANRAREPPSAERGYLAQPEMRELIGTALKLDWTLIPYEADPQLRPPELPPLSIEETNWREDQQARNLVAALATLAPQAALLVWCGNHHLAKRATGKWRPMGAKLTELAGLEPFAIDQALTVRFDERRIPVAAAWAETHAETLAAMGGTAGFLAEEAPREWSLGHIADAYLLSIDNELT